MFQPTTSVTLGKLPKTVVEVWKEWTTGSGGAKPCSLWTPAERGKFKTQISRRQNIWDIMLMYTGAGFEDAYAIDKIKQAYGKDTRVSNIIIQIVKDKKTGGHPLLKLDAAAPSGRRMRRERAMEQARNSAIETQ